ncbi:MAG: MFS transporter [Ktedonobacterales bacterium]
MLSVKGLLSGAGWSGRRQRRETNVKQSIFSALRFYNYRLFWLGQLVSVTGTFMQSTAQQWLVLTLTSSPVALGIVGALQFGPMLIPLGGAVADRFPRRNVLMFTQAAAGLLAFVLFLLTITHAVQIWHVYTLAFMLGIVNSIDMPTRQAFVSEMVPRESLLNAVSLNSAQFNASRIVGPGIAGALIALFGVPPLFLLNALSFSAVIAGLALMHTSELIPVPRRVGDERSQIRALSDGVRFVWSNPRLRVTFLMVGVIGTLGFNFNVLVPLEAQQTLHAGPAAFGLLTSSLGVGALAGALLLAKRSGQPTNKWLAGMGAAFGLLLSSLLLAHTVQQAMVVMALIGFAMSSFSASANTRVQLASPPEIRGRVMSVYTMVFVGTTPFGNLIVSGLASSTGSVPLSFALSGLPCFLVALVAAYLWSRQPASGEQPASTTAGELVSPTIESGDTPANALPVSPALTFEDTAPHRSASDLPHASLTGRILPRTPGQPKLQPRAADHE